MKVYVVTAYRHGDKEKHSYVVGVYNSIEIAKYAAEIETTWRAGKYECDIVPMAADDRVDNKKREYYLEVCGQ